jgi:hypothetical protein
MELEIISDAPNGEQDRAKLRKLFENEGFYIHSMTLHVFPNSEQYYFKTVVEQSDTFKQD